MGWARSPATAADRVRRRTVRTYRLGNEFPSPRPSRSTQLETVDGHFLCRPERYLAVNFGGELPDSSTPGSQIGTPRFETVVFKDRGAENEFAPLRQVEDLSCVHPRPGMSRLRRKRRFRSMTFATSWFAATWFRLRTSPAPAQKSLGAGSRSGIARYSRSSPRINPIRTLDGLAMRELLEQRHQASSWESTSCWVISAMAAWAASILPNTLLCSAA